MGRNGDEMLCFIFSTFQPTGLAYKLNFFMEDSSCCKLFEVFKSFLKHCLSQYIWKYVSDVK